MANNELIALIDLGDTLADCAKALRETFAYMRQPDESEGDETLIPLPSHLEARRQAVMTTPGFWRELQPRKEGFELLRILRDMGFRVHILTKGPYAAPHVWADKVAWCHAWLPDVPVIVTEDKSRVHGHLLVDDWLPYVKSWQRQWPTGLAIVPSQPWNVRDPLGSRCILDAPGNRDTIIRLLRNTFRLPETNEAIFDMQQS